MIVKSVNLENWIISWDNRNCYKLNKEQLGTHWILGFHGDDYFCCEPGFIKTIDVLLREYHNEKIFFKNKYVIMTNTEETVMAGYAMKLFWKKSIEMTRQEILSFCGTDPNKLDNRVIKRLTLRGLIEIVDIRYFYYKNGKIKPKVIRKYILLEKGISYCNLLLIILLYPPISISTSCSTVTLESS